MSELSDGMCLLRKQYGATHALAKGIKARSDQDIRFSCWWAADTKGRELAGRHESNAISKNQPVGSITGLMVFPRLPGK